MRGIVSIKPVVGSLPIYVRSSPKTVDWKEADHYQPYPKRSSYVVRFVSRRRLMPNATMIRNVAQIDTSKLRPLLSGDALSRVAECCRARLEFGQVRHRAKLQERDKRRANRQHLLPVNNSE